MYCSGDNPEESSFWVGTKVRKVSSSGLFTNERVLCIDQKSISYYSNVPKNGSIYLDNFKS